MKKLLSLLSIFMFFIFVGSGLYVFGLPPFQSGSSLLPAAPAQTQITTEQTLLPDTLKDEKTTRTKSYDEHIKRGQLLEDNNYNVLALAEYQAANKLQPANPEPFVKIGRIHLRNRELEAARQSFETALKLQPENIDTKIYLGRTLLADRKISEAQIVFNQIDADTQSAKYYQGIVAAYFGYNEKSKTLLKRSVQIGTNQDLTNKANNFLNAFSEFESYQGGKNTHLKTLIAGSLDQTGEYQAAIGLLFEVIKEQKDYRDAWIILGHAYLNLEKYKDALDALNQARILDPQKPETFFYLGLNYYGLNNLKEAAANLEKAKKLGYQPVIQINQKLAEIYLQLQEYEKSASNYENVVSLNDNDINYYIRPMWLYLEKLNRPDKALSLAQKALVHHPNEAMSYNLLGWAQIGNNKLVEAEKNLQDALKKDPLLDAAYLNYGLLEEKKGQLKIAADYYRKAHDLGKGNSISNAAADRYNTVINKIKDNENINLKANVLEEN